MPCTARFITRIITAGDVPAVTPCGARRAAPVHSNLIFTAIHPV
ncbi:hypothetical protein BDK89_0628 [Ilumatobacter fluminis]|uniref:Uncharacterized protein n=1 Tax=Ilumatobacter fluminis TaxID=467091 RepID=A0A4V3EIM5_9ACTN|nr:hypothetical protein BDK89_0628 [Ilumatobacter fluminis]